VQPSGEQLEIRHGGQRAVVVEQGGGIRAYEVDGVPVVDGYGVDEMAGGGRGQVLLPWPNRLHGGYAWDGREHAVPLDKPAEGNAMHGLVRWRSWRPAAAGPDAVTMTLRLLPQPAYPFALDLAVRYGLDDDGLTVTTSATNVGRDAAPYGHGAHPYLTVGTPTVDDVVLHVPADAWLETDEDQIPIGRRPVEGSVYDFRSPRPIGRAELDHAFTGLRRRGWLGRLWPFIALLPIYFAMTTVAAWRGLFELAFAPFRWNKTEHGLARTSRAGRPTATERGPGRLQRAHDSG